MRYAVITVLSVVLSMVLFAAGEEEKPEAMMMMSARAMRLEYTSLEDAVLYAESGPVVLMFVDGNAESMALERAIEEGFAELPPNLVLITVPFGEEVVRSQLGVSEPGSFVIIDEQGNAEMRWTGGDVETLNSMIMKSQGSG